MKKQIVLTKKLIKDIVVLSLVVVLLGGAAFYVYNYVTGQEKRKKDVESSIQRTVSQIDSIRQNYEKANVSVEIYKEVSDGLTSGAFQTDDEVLREALLKLKERYRLSQLNLKLEPEQSYQGTSIVSSNTVVDLKYRKIELKLGGMSDVHIYSFVSALQKELSGLVEIEHFSIKREKNISNDELFRISKGAIPQAVSADLKFFWIDLREKEV